MKRRLSLGLLLALPGLALWLNTSSPQFQTRPDTNPPSHSSIPDDLGTHPEDGTTQMAATAQGTTSAASAPAPRSRPASPTPAASGPATPTTAPAANKLTPSMLAAINALEAEKASRTPVQLKIDSQLLFADKMRRGVPIAEGVARLEVELEKDARGRIKVDLKAKVTPEILGAIAAADGEVLDAHEDYEAIRAWLALGSMEEIAGRPDVTFVRPASKAVTNAGSVTSRGYYTHQANVAATQFKATGKGVKVGVLSDSIDGLANAQAKGDLGPVTVLTNRFGKVQDGVPASGEGTAMLEIVHDMAPDAQLFYATAFNGEASFAQNIRDLRFRLGCDIIVDDVSYLSEPTFQDGIIAQAVEAVVADGAMYFSAAGNSGNKDQGTSGTWEGDFVDSGETTAFGGRVHKFPSGSSNKVLSGGSQECVLLFWSDPRGRSSSDYDVYVFDASNEVVGSSSNVQNGSHDAEEFIGRVAPGQRIVVVKRSGPSRFIHLGSGRGRLVDTTSGRIRGHAAALGALAVAAVDVAKVGPTSPFVSGAKCPVEDFSSDGPRRVFFRADGTPYTPNNFSSTGGVVRQKPDIAAANGVATTLPSDSGLNPFFGTSAAAPHAAAVAALVKSYNPDLTPAQVRSVLLTTALDNEQPGVDRNSGYGIVMASAAIRAVGPPIQPSITGFDPVSGPVGQQVQIQGLKLDGVTNVSFGGAAAEFVIQSSSIVVATVPVGAASGPISIRTAALQTNSAAPFTVRTTPVLLAATPSSGGPGTRVTLRGAYLAGTTQVQFNGTSASFSQVSGNELSATVPLNATTGRITAVTPNRTATNATVFTVLPTPVITGFTPDRGGMGTRVVVTGANLGQITAASIGGTAAPFVINNANQVTLTVPQGATTGTLSVTSAQGTATSSQAFTVLPTPVIALVLPMAAPVGDPVFLLGTNLLAATDVQFNGRPTDFFALDENLVVAVVPPDATTGPVTVVTPSGTGTSPTSFVVLPPPPNDRFATPIVLSGASGSVTNSNVAATKEAGEANHAGNKGGRSIWYQWTAPADGVWRFDTAGSTNDTLLAVYSGPSLTTLTNLASNDDASAALSTSRVLFPVTKDATYRIAVDGFNTGNGAAFETSSGTLRLNWAAEALAPQVTALSTNRARVGEIVFLSGVNLGNSPEVTFNGVRAVVFVGRRGIYATVPPGNVSGDVVVTTMGGTSKAPVPFTLIVPPENDWFSGAKAIGNPSGTESVSTVYAQSEVGEPKHDGNVGGRSVWYRWAAPKTGLFLFDTAGSSFDTVLAAYSGNTLGSLVRITSTDDAGAEITSRILLQAQASSYYYIAVDGAEGASGTARLNWSEVGSRPVITAFAPLDGGVGSVVTLTGVNLTNVTSVRIGDTAVTNDHASSSTNLWFRIPTSATDGVITVVTTNGTATSPGPFRVTDAPANDNLVNWEIPLNPAELLPFNNAKATGEAGEPRHAFVDGGKSLWYPWLAPTNGFWSIDTAGSSFDTTLAAYQGRGLSDLKPVAWNDDFQGNDFSRIEVLATTSSLFFIAVDGFMGSSGDGFLRIQPLEMNAVGIDANFEAIQGYNALKPLSGQAGWTSTSTSGNGIINGFMAGSPQQAFVGYSGTGTLVWRNVPASLAQSSQKARFDVDFAIYESTNGRHDDFWFRIYNSSGQELVSIGVDSLTLGMAYTIDSGARTFIPTSLVNRQAYHLAVWMDFTANRWSATLDGRSILYDAVITAKGSQRSLGSVAAAWVPKWILNPGNNRLVFDNLKVTVPNGLGLPSITQQSSARSIRAGLSTSLDVVADGMPPFAYQWHRNGAPIAGANGPQLRLAKLRASDAGNYTVTISNPYGTVVSRGMSVGVVLPEVAMESPDTLRVTCAPSQRVRVEVSSDLTTWATLVSQAAGTDGVLRAKTSAGTVSHAFYRVVLE